MVIGFYSDKGGSRPGGTQWPEKKLIVFQTIEEAESVARNTHIFFSSRANPMLLLFSDDEKYIDMLLTDRIVEWNNDK